MPIPVYFDPAMLAKAHSISPSLGKPALVVADWQQQGFAIDIEPFKPVTHETLSLAHDPRFVQAIFEGKTNNGFDNRDPAIAESARYTCGAMLRASLQALVSETVAVAPVSGFHHAYYESCHGFCTFNGLMVAAVSLHQSKKVGKVGILDLDQHWGDGTEDIIQELAIDWIQHYSAGATERDARHARPFLDMLERLVESFSGCDILMYQAGADPHVKDPLGGWMTTEQLQERDRIVFTTAHRMGLPVVWNLAGGYQRDASGGIAPVLEIHRNTMRECLNVYEA